MNFDSQNSEENEKGNNAGLLKNKSEDKKNIKIFEDNNIIQNYSQEELNQEEIKEQEETQYMQDLYSQLAKITKERKESQINAKILANRLNLLKLEEKKEMIKLENAKSKANTKLLRLKEIVEINKIQEQIKKSKELEIEQKKKNNMKMKCEIKNNIDKNRALHEKKIKEEANLIKTQKEYNKQMLDIIKKKKINDNKTKYVYYKNQKSINEEKKKLLQRQKRLLLKKELEKKLMEEYKLKEEAEAKKIKAEKEEIEVIKKLQATTKMHKDINEEMERMNLNSVTNGEFGNLEYSNESNNNLSLFKSNNK